MGKGRQPFSATRAAVAREIAPAFIELVVRRLNAISDPTRIFLIRILEQGEANVQELTDLVPTTHQNVSKHLALLLRAGIVSRRREGNTVVYSLSDYSVCRLLELAVKSATGYIEELADLVPAAKP